jgi:predicted PurR-regulated permease PerM
MKNEQLITRKNLFYTLIGIGLLYFTYMIRSILSPFAIGFFVAYCVKDFVAKYEKKFSRRLMAISIIMVFFVTIFLLLLFLVPMIYQQLSDMAKQFLYFTENFNVWEFYHKFEYIFRIMHIETAEELQSHLSSIIVTLVKRVSNITNIILSSSTQTFNLMLKIFLIPIITYYFIVDWKKIIKSTFNLIPDGYKNNTLTLLEKINTMIHHYIVGQLLVTLILSSIYTILLLIIRFDFAIMLGITAGCLTLLPYVGSVAGFVMALFLVLFKHGFVVSKIISVFCAFSIGQFLEGNFITPNIIGKRIELHQLWVIFSVLVGGTLYGFWGMLLSLPIAAIIGIVIRYSTRHKIKQQIKIKIHGADSR